MSAESNATRAQPGAWRRLAHAYLSRVSQNERKDESKVAGDPFRLHPTRGLRLGSVRKYNSRKTFPRV